MLDRTSSKPALVVLLWVLAPTIAACGAAVDNWTAAMAGHAATSKASSFTRAPPPDYRDCNGNLLDGRETDVSTSSANCGACGARCDGTCGAGVCSPRSAGAEAHEEPKDWRTPAKPLTSVEPTETTSSGKIGKASMPAFEFDTEPVETWRYAACHRSGPCESLFAWPPEERGPNAPAVGMRIEAAEAFCRTRDMSLPTPAEEQVILANSRPPAPSGINPSLDDLIIDGFRCVRPAASP
jgi:hypothetical protein